jgi:toxin HigB-1
VEVVFADKKLELIEDEDRAHELRLPPEVINSCRDKLHKLRQAPDMRTVMNWRGLRYERLKGDRDGQESVRINDQWRIVFVSDTKQIPTRITVLEVEDYH